MLCAKSYFTASVRRFYFINKTCLMTQRQCLAGKTTPNQSSIAWYNAESDVLR